MRKFIVAIVIALMAMHASASQLKQRNHGHTVHRRDAANSYGPYYLGFAGYCNVFELWYDPDTSTIYGNEIGCTGGAVGRPVMGAIDSGGYDLFLTVGGGQDAIMIDADLYNNVAAWGASSGNDPDISQTDVTLDTNPVAPDSGPSLYQ